MKKIIFLIILGISVKCYSQVQNLSGPRIGFTLLMDGETTDYVTGIDGSPSTFISQYGWQYESRFASGENITGLVEWVLLVGAMERGKFLPSISSLVGFRNSEGIEMGFEPNLSLGGIGVVFGFGMTMTSGKLNIPINFVYSPQKENSGSSFNVLLGFNMSKN